MSRSYNMSFVIRDPLTAEEYEKIRDAAYEEWDFEDDNTFLTDREYPINMSNMYMYGKGSLCVGESEEDFVESLSKAIWKAIGRYIKIEVTATYLEELPYEVYTTTEHDYNKFKKSIDKEGIK